MGHDRWEDRSLVDHDDRLTISDVEHASFDSSDSTLVDGLPDGDDIAGGCRRLIERTDPSAHTDLEDDRVDGLVDDSCSDFDLHTDDDSDIDERETQTGLAMPNPSWMAIRLLTLILPA